MRWCVVVIAASLCAACPPAPPPPPAACEFGQDLDGNCVIPWAATCASAGADGCVPGSPTRCDVDDEEAVPAYDCSSCGCGPSAFDPDVENACVDTGDFSFCLEATFREGERSDERISDGLEDDDYVGLYRSLLEDGRATRAQVMEHLRQVRDFDARHSLVVVGTDEDARALLPDLFDGSFGRALSGEDCAGTDAGLLDDDNDGAVIVTPRDRAHDFSCTAPGVFARCTFPSVAACSAATGMLPSTVLLLGDKSLDDLDNALLRKATRAGRDEWLARLDAQLQLFTDVFITRPSAAFDVEGGSLVFLLGVGDPLLGVFVSERASPAQLRAFRSMWDDAEIQLFLTEQDITPDECTFAVDRTAEEDVVSVSCAKNGATVSGDVVGVDVRALVLTAP